LDGIIARDTRGIVWDSHGNKEDCIEEECWESFFLVGERILRKFDIAWNIYFLIFQVMSCEGF